MQDTLDPLGAALVTAYEFYCDAANDGGGYGHLRQKTNADGSWEIHTYDAAGRALKTIRPYLDAVSTDAENLCRVTSITYGTIPDGDNDALEETLRTTVEFVLGQEVSRSYRIDWSNLVTFGGDSCTNRTDIRCVSAGAAWNDPANLVTKTLFYSGDLFIGRVRRIVNPDGTATFSAYSVDSSGQLTATIKTGAINLSADDILAGTRTISFTSPTGQVIGVSSTDIASGLALSSWTATAFDSLNRPTRLDYSDGTYEIKDYTCCGLASTRDRSGLATSYGYDDLGRQTTVARSGIVIRTGYDADGRVQSVTRIGSDQSEIIQESHTYDLAGRLTARRDALNRTTSYTEVYDNATGHTTRTTATPAGTSIELSARDGSPLSTSGTAVAPRAYEYGIENGGFFTKQILIGENSATAEWVKTFTDFVGHPYKVVYADGAVAQSFYNSIGQLVRQVDPDGVTALFAYNSRGEQSTIAIDLDGNNAIDFAGRDGLRTTLHEVANHGEYVVQRTTTQVYESDDQDTPTTESISEVATDGLHSWETVRGLTSFSVATLDGSGGRTIVTTAPDTTRATQVYLANHLQAVSTINPSLGALESTTYEYDAHGRLKNAIDARSGTTTYSYYSDDQIQTVITPDPDLARAGPGYDPQTTSYTYDSAGRLDTVTHPDNSVVHATYYPTGAVKRVWGSRVYPTEYTYDPQGRLKSLTTWQDFAGDAGQAITSWNYDPIRGWLDNKRYADGSGPRYTYKPSGRLVTRTWARTPVVTTTYGYTGAGDLQSIDYSDATPDVSVTYNRLGRPKSINDGAGFRGLSFDASGQLKDEDYSAGMLNGLGVHRGFDAQSRLNKLSAFSGASELSQVSYDYDEASRLRLVTSGPNTATYGYELNSSLVQTITFAQGGSTRLVAAKNYDNLYRLASITNTPSGAPASAVSYTYNEANQRIKATREDNAYWNYDYDALGQVTVGKKFGDSGDGLPGYDFAWIYDDIGNRRTATTNSQTSSFTANALNQYSTRTVPGVVDVMGAAAFTATVTVALNDSTPQQTTRSGELFFKQLSVNNASAAQNPSIKITGVKNLVGAEGEDAVSMVSRNSFVPQTPEIFIYDEDGNLTDDARWHYSWDAENRLIAMSPSAVGGALRPDSVRLEFAYDAEGRRVSKKVYNWTQAAWVLGTSTRFLNDGWNTVAELDALDGNSPISTHAWGLDLSGSLQGAGGGGGLLFSNTYLSPSSYLTHSAAYDGNGNIINLIDLATGTTSATYDYDAFGKTLQREGEASSSNHYRFSTKYSDDETGLLYYGFRYYCPSAGRWLSRDPIEENGGVNLYGFVGNHSTRAIDFLGLQEGWEEVERLSTYQANANGMLDTAQAGSRAAYNVTSFVLDAGIEVAEWELGLRAAGIIVRGAKVIRILANGKQVEYEGPAAKKLLVDEIAALEKAAKASKCVAADRVNPMSIRFTQSTVSQNLSTDQTLTELVNALRSGEVLAADLPAIRVVERNGILYSLDNRRLVAFQQAGLFEIPIQRVSLSNPAIMKEFLRKFNPVNGGQNIVVTPNAAGRAAAETILKQYGKIK